MKPVISITGVKNSGKTTLLEKLISEFKSRKYKVGVIKHDVHAFTMDHPGKDTYRHKEAGAFCVSISGKTQFAFITDVENEMPVENVIEKYYTDVDLILTEGFNKEKFPKIEITRILSNHPPISDMDNNLKAIVSDYETGLNVPHFGLDDTKQLVDYIIDSFLK